MSGQNKPVFVRPFKEEARPGLPGRTQRGLCSLCLEQRGGSELRCGGPPLAHPEPSSSQTPEPGKVEDLHLAPAGIPHGKG